jgi:segregation and condensation protein B
VSSEEVEDEHVHEHVSDEPNEAVAEAAPEAEAEAAPEAEAAAEAEAAPEADAVAEAEADPVPTPLDLDLILEALIFASDRPLPLARLRHLSGIRDAALVEASLTRLAERYVGRGIVLAQVSGGYQFRTAPSCADYVQELIAGKPVRLSRAQLETLAIIAYRQPITRPEIDDIRGVDSSGTLRVLLERELVRVLGKREEVGRPMLYGTTKEFLDFFSLGDLRELPTLREYAELTAESAHRLAELDEEPSIDTATIDSTTS